MDERDTAGVTIRLILDYVRGEAGTDGLEAMLALAGETRPLAVLEAPAPGRVATHRCASSTPQPR